MSFTLRNHFTLPNCNINSPKSHFEAVKFCFFLAPKPQLNPLNFQKFQNRWAIRVNPLEKDDGMVGWRRNNNYSANKDFNFDAFLSILEFLSLASSAVMSVIIFAVNYSGLSGSSQRSVLGWFGNRVLVSQWQWVGLMIGVVLGAVIRRRQWKRICSADFSRQPVNLVERIEKLEEDLKSSTTIIRVLSRQLEKLGIRFRVTRKALKEPIAETAALAQKNSEATRALAAQEDNLEKELGEIQKVLLAMQEQQQKQLELILAIGTSGKLWDNKREQNNDDNATNASNSPVDRFPQVAPNQVQARARQKEASSD